MNKSRCSLKKGQVFVMMIFMITILLTVSGLVIDIGRLSITQQRMKRAADAAALAGARMLPDDSAANTEAVEFAGQNGFADGANGIAVTSTVDPLGNNPNWFRVTISMPFRFSFARIVGLTEKNLSVFSTAQFNTSIPININLFDVYGQDNPLATLGIRGRGTLYEHGDPRATRRMITDTQGDPNQYYNPDGYSYRLYVPSNYRDINSSRTLNVEIYDPDSYGNYDSAGDATTTYYTLYGPGENGAKLATYSCSGYSDREKSGTWYRPNGFSINTSIYGTGVYQIKVTVGNGYNANGFSFRAGPPTATFNPNNGTQILSDGPLCLRFNQVGAVSMNLGFVPEIAAGSKLHIKKFDTEIGAQYIIYTCSTLPGQTWRGELLSDSQGNAKWLEDIIDIPLDYKGGVWTARYNAGASDFSYWEMWFEGMSEEEEGFVFLVE